VRHVAISFLGWLGWMVGIVSGTLHVQSWRKDRRLGPAKEQLFEEALRDRKGIYSEEQITELTKLVHDLERSSKTEIPRQARRVFLQSQLEEINDSVATNVKRHQALAEELRQLGEETKSIPQPLADVIDSSIVPPATFRRRQIRRLYFLAALILAGVVVPGPFNYVVDSVRSASESLLGSRFLIFGAENIIAYALGVAIGIFVAFSLPISRLSHAVRRHRSAIYVSAGLL
jgi:hypothetical protein